MTETGQRPSTAEVMKKNLAEYLKRGTKAPIAPMINREKSTPLQDTRTASTGGTTSTTTRTG